jgi:hypothetical protein
MFESNAHEDAVKWQRLTTKPDKLSPILEINYGSEHVPSGRNLRDCLGHPVQGPTDIWFSTAINRRNPAA